MITKKKYRLLYWFALFSTSGFFIHRWEQHGGFKSALAGLIVYPTAYWLMALLAGWLEGLHPKKWWKAYKAERKAQAQERRDIDRLLTTPPVQIRQYDPKKAEKWRRDEIKQTEAEGYVWKPVKDNNPELSP